MPSFSAITGLLAEMSSPIDAEVALSDSFSDDEDGLDDLFSPYLTSPGEELDEPPSGAAGRRGAAGAGAPGEPPSDATGERLRALQAENESLKRKLKLSDDEAQANLASYRATVEAAQARTRDEVRSLREALVKVQGEIPALRERLHAAKSSFAGLRIPADKYRQIVSAPEERTSVVEYVQARVYELLGEAERPISELREQHTVAAVAQTGLATQLNSEGSARAAAESQARQLKVELFAVRQELDSARMALSAARVAASGASAPAPPPTEFELMLEAHDRTSAADARLEEVRSEARRAAEAAEAAACEAAAREQMIGLDKAYLSSQLQAEREKLLSAETELTRREGRVAELKAERDAMHDKLMSFTTDQAAGYSGRIDSELAKWERQAALSAARTEAQHEVAISQLREGRDLALADTDKWRVRHDEAVRLHSEAAADAAARLAAGAAALADTRSELKLKIFEAERLSSQLEVALAGSRRDALAVDASREKLDLLKAEYYSLQASSARRQAETDAQLLASKERLQVYEGLERELDEAVLQSGASGGGAPAVRVPSSAEARLRQCVELSAELLAARRLAEGLRAAVTDREAEAERTRLWLREQLGDASRRSRLGSSPQGYLIEQLEQAEQRAQQQTRRAEAAARDAAERAAALDTSQHQQRLLRSDLERLLQQRGSIDALRTTLSNLL